ncbi:MAG: tetratricopeptide repeat protein [Deltaproteobacteria bacterium]|nr:tetratricopeptide repeat protein [Deltaproteobacteria bacterium]
MENIQMKTPDRPATTPVKRKKRVRKPGTKRPLGYRIGITLFIAAIALGAFKLWTCLNVADPHFDYMDATLNGEALVLLNGETARFHPGDRLRIIDISTNICFNRGVRIVSEGMDADSLVYGEVLLSEVLPEKDIYSGYTFRLDIKFKNTLMGYIDLVVEPQVKDWLDRVDRVIDPDRRIDVLKQAQDVFPDERQIKNRLVSEYINQQKWADAARMLEGLVRENPDPESYGDLLDVYEKMQNAIGAVSVLRKMIDLKPDDLDLKIKLADVLESSGRITEAIEVYEALLEGVKGKDLLPVYNSLGYLYAEKGDNDKAISFYLKALDLNKEDANIYDNLSLLYEKTGQKDKANQYLAGVIELRPDSKDDKMKLAGNLLEAGKIQEAEENIGDFLKVHPGSMDAWMLMARIAEKKGDRTALQTAYEKIMGLDPLNSAVMYNLGVMEYDSGNQEKASDYFEKYIISSPDDETARSFLFEIYRTLKKDDLAYREASAIIKLKPDESECWKYIFEYLNKKQRYSDIISIMQEGVETSPKDVSIRKYLIGAYLKTGKENLAITHMKAALELQPKDEEMLMQLARLYEQQNKTGEALDTYKKALEINPENAEAEDAYLRLRLKTIGK